MAQDTLVAKEKEEEKKEGEKEVTGDDKKDDKLFGRVKDRLSLRKSKKDKKTKVKDQEDGKNDLEEDKKENGKVNVEEETKEKEENKKSFIQRIIQLFSSKKKKKNVKPVNEDEPELEIVPKEEETVKEDADKEPAKEETVPQTSVQLEPPSPEPLRPVTPAAKPPSGRAMFLATTPRPPCSATASQTRPLSQLDAALKQFKVSTAASRENLRSSHQDLSQVEEQVRNMTLSRNSSLRMSTGHRPPLARPANNPTTIPITLSASLTDLRHKQEVQAEGGVRASVCVN